MSISWTDPERAYLDDQQRLARVATANPNGLPDIAVVAFRFVPDEEVFLFGGSTLEKTIKYHNLLKNNQVSIVVDDVETWSPYTPRGIKVTGPTEMFTATGAEGLTAPDKTLIKVSPDRKWSWGVNQPPFRTDPFGFILEQQRRS